MGKSGLCWTIRQEHACNCGFQIWQERWCVHSGDTQRYSGSTIRGEQTGILMTFLERKSSCTLRFFQCLWGHDFFWIHNGDHCRNCTTSMEILVPYEVSSWWYNQDLSTSDEWCGSSSHPGYQTSSKGGLEFAIFPPSAAKIDVNHYSIQWNCCSGSHDKFGREIKRTTARNRWWFLSIWHGPKLGDPPSLAL